MSIPQEARQLAAAFAAALQPEDSLLILPHQHADGDAIGAGLALYLAARRLELQPELLLDEPLAPFLAFLPEHQAARVYDGKERQVAATFILDHHDAERMTLRRALWDAAPRRFCIDHHPAAADPENTLSWLQASASSTCELLTFFLLALEEEKQTPLIDAMVATCLLAGIYTDTGSFAYSNVGAASFQAAAELRARGARPEQLHEKLFSTISLRQRRAEGFLFIKARWEMEGRLAFAFISKAEIQALEVSDAELGNIASELREVAGTDLAIFFREEVLPAPQGRPAADSEGQRAGAPSCLRISFRSSERIDCSRLAALFGGGGHKRAAGATVMIEIDMLNSLSRVLDMARQTLASGALDDLPDEVHS